MSCHSFAEEEWGRWSRGDGEEVYLLTEGAEEGGKTWRETWHYERKRGTQRGKIAAWTKTSTPTPAALAASSLRGRTAAGLLGEMWDGQGECCSTNPQGEGGEVERFQWDPCHFHSPSPPAYSDVMTAEYRGTAGLTAQMHDHKYCTALNALRAWCWQVSESNMIVATGLCCHYWRVKDGGDMRVLSFPGVKEFITIKWSRFLN